VTDVLSQRALNRATLARQYLLERAPLSAVDAIEHLVSARDGLDWPAFFAPLHAGQFRANFRSGTEGVDQEELLGQARRLLAERPRTRAELGRLLGERWPEAEPRALAYAATHHLVLCQVPPRGHLGQGRRRDLGGAGGVAGRAARFGAGGREP
jgi:hypothetical protein